MRTFRTAAAIGLAAAALAGCSGAQAAVAPAVDPVQLLASAKSNAHAATSVHIRGRGECPQGGFSVDMNVRRDGHSAGQVIFGRDIVNVVATPDALYLNGTTSFWTLQSSKATAAKIGQRWLKVPKATNPCIDALTDLSLLETNLLSDTTTPSLLTGEAFAGQPARQIGFSADVAYWIATSGTLLPINVHDAGSNTDIVLDKWNDDLQVLVPPARDVVTPAQVT